MYLSNHKLGYRKASFIAFHFTDCFEKHRLASCNTILNLSLQAPLVRGAVVQSTTEG